MEKEKLWILTDNYFAKGGNRGMVDGFIKFIGNAKFSIIVPANLKTKCIDNNVICVKNRFIAVYLLRILSLIKKVASIPKKEKIYIFSDTPLYAIIPILLSRKANIWFGTTFFHEFIHKDIIQVLKKDKIIGLVELFLLPIYYLLENLVMLGGKIKYFALSNYTKGKIIFNKKVKILHQPIEEFWFHQNNIDKRNKNILSVGRFNDSRKDLPTLLKTASELTGYNFIVVGKLPEDLQKERYKNINFMGELSTKEEIKEIANKSLIFFLPSKQEGLGIVYIEAMASGLPVVTMKNGGAEDIVKYNKSGYLCDIGDYENASQKIKLLLRNNKLYNTFSENPKIFAKRYQKQAWEQMEEFYRK